MIGFAAALRLLVPAGLAAVLVAGIAIGGHKPASNDFVPGPVEVTARPLAGFDLLDVDRSSFGKVTWRGGLVLTGRHRNFGGWSGLLLDDNGSDFLAVSDAGSWMSGQIAYDAAGKPAGMQSVRLGPLLAADGKPLGRARQRDAEGLTLEQGTIRSGRLLVSFEHNHRIVQYAVDADGVKVAGEQVELPAEARSMSRNAGFEAIAVMRGGPHAGALVAISEGLRDRGNHVGWVWVEGEPRRFLMTNAGGYDVTDATPLADGALLVLERRYRVSEGVRMRLRRIPPQALQPGALIDAEVLLTADPSREIDNMEGMAAHVAPGGETVVTLISDDNFNPSLQRTLLLQFVLAAEDKATAAGTPAPESNQP